MPDENILKASLAPAVLTASVATGGFVAWLRLRRGIYPRLGEVASQFILSCSGGTIVGYYWLMAQSRNREALRRMMVTEKIEVRSRGSGAAILDPAEFDKATGVEAERISEDLMRAVSSNKNP